MLKDLNWGPLNQRCIDSRLMRMYKVTYDLVAIPASLYLVQNTRASRHTPSLAYRQIQTLKDYYRFTFFPRTIIHWSDLPAKIRTLPTLAQFSSAVMCPLNANPWFYLNEHSFLHCTNSSYHLFYHFVSTTTQNLVFPNTHLMSPRGLRRNGRKRERVSIGIANWTLLPPSPRKSWTTLQVPPLEHVGPHS